MPLRTFVSRAEPDGGGELVDRFAVLLVRQIHPSENPMRFGASRLQFDRNLEAADGILASAIRPRSRYAPPRAACIPAAARGSARAASTVIATSDL